MNEHKYIQINSYTKILATSQEHAEELQKKTFVPEKIKDPNYLKIKKNRNHHEQKKLYKKFCNKVFKERNFINMKDFNQLILEHFNTNSTYYRKRMVVLKLIEIRQKLIFHIDGIHKENND
jgi:hypothetical protein